MTNVNDVSLDDLARQVSCSHTQRSGGNDYLQCSACGLIWDYRKEGPDQRLLADMLVILTNHLSSLARPTTISSLGTGLRELSAKWREAAVLEEFEMGNTECAHALDQCADELDAVLTIVAAQWQTVENSMPGNGRTVLVYFVNEHGKGRRVRAAYFAADTLDMEDGDSDWQDVNEEGRNVHPGWFEDSDSHEPAYWPLSGTPTHWMPLPEAP